MSKRPAVIDAASWLLWLLVAAGAVVAVLVVVFQDEVAEAWSPIRYADSEVQPIDFVPVVLVLYVVVALTMMCLIPLLRHGHNWARHSLVGISIGILLAAMATVRTGPPRLIQLCSIAAAVLAAVCLVFLWHVDSRRYCLESRRERDAALAEESEQSEESSDVTSGA
jgi:hypothetical protein